MENTVILKIKNATCSSCAKKIINGLENEFGNDISATFDFATRNVIIDFNEKEHQISQFIQNIKKTGYKAEEIEE